ncbi:tripartite tricarboxylate transporter substrate binding protein [Ramlibacter sp. AW1]|uniref:Tripartite tricarboxylate transporter substrate binding protein n=1 Tax=Ramlibacter aurantiacus TaxID=2801330 RepID=A0A936ZCI5_9BURK|nr:tripartite tricarboxylate transporter substrate binding protein [Ramlibacter aurantiacus]MBL0419094.1 tripartite tricarboxylate transporter substrate binding protein [Ramlibacter aurantiacus]
MRQAPLLLPRRTLLLAAALAPLAGWTSENWPTRPVRVIVPTFPGSPPDVAVRALADQVEKRLGQAIVVENKGGAQGTIGLGELARAEPDGYTFGLLNLQSTATPALRKTPYDLRTSFTPVTQLTTEAPVLIVSNKLPAKDMKSLVEHIRSHPGQLSYGSAGSGSPSHLGMELLLREIGGKVTHIPYKGAAAAGTDVAGGQIEMALVASAVARQLLQGSRVRAIAVSSDKRLRSMPEVPTLAEAGFPQIDLRGWVGLVGPAGLPPAIVNKMQAAVAAALESPAVQARLDTTGATAAPSRPEAFAAFVAQEAQRWQRVVADAKIQFD